MNNEAPLDAALRAQDPDAQDPIRVRWLLALGLLACAASLFLVEALYAAMDHDAHFAVAPALFQWDNVARARIAGLRGDRLDPDRTASSVPEDQIRIEQLSSSGLGIRPFTHVVAFLAHLSADRASPPAPAAIDAATPATLGLPAKILSRSPRAAPESAAGSLEPQPLGEPINVTPVPESPPGSTATRRLIVARRGDSLAKILLALGASSDQAQNLDALYAGGGAAVFVGGEKISILERKRRTGAPGAPLEVRVERDGAPAWAAALADNGGYAPMVASATEETASAPPRSSESASGDLDLGADESVQDALGALVQSRGVNQSLVDEIMRLCAHDFDLDAPIAATDRIEFLYTPGDLNEPELRFVRLTAQGKTHDYYRFTAPDDGSVDYYDRSGRSVTKFLLRKPVPAGRLGDGFGWRLHPILKNWLFHEGVDYDAPMGSPVEAAGAGVVEKIGQEWGYGKYVRIKHDLGYETTYAHLSGVAAGVKVGTRVRQGEVIAHVGSTGLSTGAHLYYEVRINGHNVNPLTIKLADGRILTGSVLADFESRRERTDELIGASAVADNAPAQPRAAN